MDSGKRIALIGTFDLENYGDILFPEMFRHFMTEYQVDLFSPHGGKRPLVEHDDVVYPVNMLEKLTAKRQYDAIVVGGGDIIIMDSRIYTYYGENYLLFELWAEPARVADKFGIPFLFNAPGVPFDFGKSAQSIIKTLLKPAAYIAVRDVDSRKRLNACGVERVVTVPDSLFALSQLYTTDRLAVKRAELSDRLPILGENYVVFQHNNCSIDEEHHIQSIVSCLRYIKETYGQEILLLPIGYAHKDEYFLGEIARILGEDAVLAEDKYTVEEMTSILAGANGYIGTSMHGAIIASQYGKTPVVNINTMGYSKIDGIYQHMGHPERAIRDITNLRKIFDEAWACPDVPSNQLQRTVQEHFERMNVAIEVYEPALGQMPIIESLFSTVCSYYDYPDQVLEVAHIYYDYGNGYSDENKTDVAYHFDGGRKSFELCLPREAIRVRIDPNERKLIEISEVSVLLDGEAVEYSLSSEVQTEDGSILLTDDPSIIVHSSGKSTLRFSMCATILSVTDICTKIGKIMYSYGLHIQSLQEHLSSSQNKTEGLELELKNTCEKLETMQNEKESLGQNIRNLNKKLEAAQKDKETSEQYTKHLCEKLTDLQGENEILEQDMCKLQEQLKTTKINNANLQNEILAIKETNKELKKMYEEVGSSLVNETESNSQLMECLDNANEKYKQLEQQYLALLDIQKQQEATLEHIEHSLSWRLTKPLRDVKYFFIQMERKHLYVHKAIKAVRILLFQGWGPFKETFRKFLVVRREEKNYIAVTGDKEKELTTDNLSGYIPYDSQYQENFDFCNCSTDIRALAFYLPQYHTFPENDQWWGDGFTEWTNVRKGTAQFPGHYQPRVPHKDIGYYCLEDIEVIRNQAKLAKEHGIYGFVFYYYWFSGKRLMEKPVDMLMENPDIDIPFCLCWANENWTRAWDGQNKNVLIGQEYSDEDDERFIVDLKKYIDDPRYIRIHGKPLVIVYNPGQIPDCERSFSKWRRVAREIGLGEILIWTCQTANNNATSLKIEDCIDAEIEFPPHNMWMESIAVRGVDLNGKSAFIYNYQKLVDYMVQKLKKRDDTLKPVHHSIMMAWDNAARRNNAWFTYYAFSEKALYRWILAVINRTREDFSEEERFIFINAWNEWGEGTYLEPDEKYGYANINTVSKALFSLPFHNDLTVVKSSDPVCVNFDTGEKARIAVQTHMFYLDTLEETITNMNKLPYHFDCYVTTDTEKKARDIREALDKSCNCNNSYVLVTENRGRDVAPFLVQMSPVIENYDYIAHIHSKKTKTNDHGNDWREFIFDHMFGCSQYLERVFHLFESDSSLGILMPEVYPPLELQAEWGGNRNGVEELLHRLGCEVMLPEEPDFPVGNMFWAKTKAVMPIFKAMLTAKDFPPEAGQVNGTLGHEIERSWVYIAKSQGYGYRKIFNAFSSNERIASRNRLCLYVHYDKDNIISDEDVKSVAALSGITPEIVFISNSKISEQEIAKIRPYVKTTMCRKNIGLDFGGWKEALLKIGRVQVERYDEVILTNNSNLSPVFPLRDMFLKMEHKTLDFWGVTLFPFSEDGSFIGKDCIPEHLQSYFMVFEKAVLQSDVFWNFWKKMPQYKDYIDVVGNCETEFTRLLENAGFRWEAYIPESKYLPRFLNNYAIPYEKPTTLLLLKSPFVKKKCSQHMSLEEKIKLKWLIQEIQQVE